MNALFIKIKKYVTEKNKLGLIVIIGLCGIVLIALSQVKTQDKTVTEKTSSGISDTEYCISLENKIKQLVYGITGDKDCIVAVTLETGSEYVYANQTNTDTDISKDSGSEKTTTKEKEKNEQEYIIIKSENGTEKPLTVTEKKPGVRGVAVVAYGVDETTKERIESSVSAMLDLSSRKINITSRY